MQQKQIILPLNQTKSFWKEYENNPIIAQLLKEQYNKVTKLCSHEETELTNLYICHATSFWPQDGIIHPRVNYDIEGPLWKIESEQKNFIKSSLSLVRPTIHFALNSLVEAHG